MSEQAEQYFADHASSSSERERLGGLCKVYDEWTQQRFIEAGLSSASRVAEIGFGTGSMMRWLSEQVGSDGCVHGFDLTPRFLAQDKEFLQQSHIELYEHDIQNTALAEPCYDFIYTRLVLAHLFDPKSAIQNIAAGLQPGGKIIALDYDSTKVHAHPDSNGAAEFDRAVDLMNREIGAKGLISASYGAEMAKQMQEVGLVDVTDTIMNRDLVGGEFAALVSAQGMDLLGEARPETADYAKLIAEKMRTPGFRYQDTDMHCAIGTKA